MEMIGNQGRIVGCIDKTTVAQTLHGRRVRRVEYIALLVLPDQPPIYRRFPNTKEARAWITQEASRAGCHGQAAA